jgi:hypothetical protein
MLQKNPLKYEFKHQIAIKNKMTYLKQFVK